MNRRPPFVDIHCHLIPDLDDGAKSWTESLEMAEMAVKDGVGTVIVTPHQLGGYAHIQSHSIRQHVRELERQLSEQGIPLQVLPGADVRIEETLFDHLRTGKVLTLADRGKHVLLELPHELYFPLEGVLDSLRALGLEGILSHPERNQGLLRQPNLVVSLVDHGCLMQVTAGSLMGTFGPACQQMAIWMLHEGLVHFLATDAHGAKSRRPLLKRAFELVAQQTDEEIAIDLCCRHPAAIAAGSNLNVSPRRQKKRAFSGWFNWRKAG